MSIDGRRISIATTGLATLCIIAACPASLAQALPPEPVDAAPAQSQLPPAPVTNIEVVDGPLKAERFSLAQKVQQAKASGVGIKPYMQAFKAMETMVTNGASEQTIQQRMDSISRGLDDQFKRSDILKSQRLSPPIAPSSPPPSLMQPSGPGSDGGDKNSLVDAIKNKWFGGEIPDSLKSKIPKNFDPNKINKEDAKKLLDKLK